ncbi:unnamed protein product [Caenorhabditis sp. 36 PRJEB53466]|nr:unnamed protein product [Caenorhabditis sp. 36 PRJEB53466]
MKNLNRFRPKAANALVQEVLAEKLGGLAAYDVDEADKISKDISATIRLQLPRYKYVVQTLVSEQCGNGATTAIQCVWDEDCDAYVHQRYVTGSIWCEVLVFAIFHY